MSEPGSLADYDRLEILRRCYVDSLYYQAHFSNDTAKEYTTSETYKMVYRMISKSGCSSARV